MKKAVAVILLGIMTVCMCACGSGKTECRCDVCGTKKGCSTEKVNTVEFHVCDDCTGRFEEEKGYLHDMSVYTQVMADINIALADNKVAKETLAEATKVVLGTDGIKVSGSKALEDELKRTIPEYAEIKMINGTYEMEIEDLLVKKISQPQAH